MVASTAKIGIGCKIGPDVSIGDGCIIGDGVRLSNCVVMRGVEVGHHSKVGTRFILVILWCTRRLQQGRHSAFEPMQYAAANQSCYLVVDTPWMLPTAVSVLQQLPSAGHLNNSYWKLLCILKCKQLCVCRLIRASLVGTAASAAGVGWRTIVCWVKMFRSRMNCT